MGQLVTLDDVQKAMPAKGKVVTQEAVDIINASLNDPEFQGESLLKTACIYEGILKGARATMPEYLNAIRFCAYISTEQSSYTEAYKKVFCERTFVKERREAPSDSQEYIELCSAASRYRKTKLVVDVLTASQVPLDMIFTGYRYKAIGVLAEIMQHSKYDRDKINAAKELLTATKGPDNVKIELDVGVTDSNALEQLDEQLRGIAAQQKTMLEHGVSNLKDFGAMKVVESYDEAEVIND
jgi:hypothetical protein